MNRRIALLLAGSGLGIQLVLHLGLLGGLPDLLRLLLALFTLVLAPGAAFLALGVLPPGGAWLAPGWALGFGVGWCGAEILVTRALGLPFTVLELWAMPANALLWCLVLARMPGGGAPARQAEPRAAVLSAVGVAAILAAAALACLHAARLGTPITLNTDSPDHIATIRRMLATGDAFPLDAFFKNPGQLGADPRKGLWHPTVALLSGLAGLDPYDAWRLLPALLAPLFVLNAAAFGFLLGGSAPAAVAAWALLLTYGGSLAAAALREAGFATKLADQLALATATAVLSDLLAPRRGTRLAAVGLALGAVAAHLFAAVQFAIVFTALAAGIALRDHDLRHKVRRLAGTALALGAACLPYLLWRARSAPAPGNLIHTQPQGLLYLFDGVRITSIGILWDWTRSLWLLFPLAWLPLWRRARGRPAVLYLLTTSLGLVLVVFNPLAVAVLEPRVGYLLMRAVWLLPVSGLLAWVLTEGARSLAGAGRARWQGAAALAVTLWLVAPALIDGARVLLDPRPLAAVEHSRSPVLWWKPLAWMDRNLPAGSVVLADPATSYSVPMLTRHYVVTLVDQHSSPNDSLALRRLLDARDALDPFGSWQRCREVCRRHGATVVALNARFAEWPGLNYWAPTPRWYAAARARLDRVPSAFERVYDRGDFVVYRIHRAALDTLSAPAPARPFVTPFVPGRFPVARRVGPNLPALLSLSLAPVTAAPGDTVRGVAEWRALAPLPPGSYRVYVRFDRPLPGGLKPPRWLAKPVRKLLERFRGERYRFRADHLPIAGTYGPDLWSPAEVVRDSFELEVPRDVAGGDYTVRIRMIRQPHYPNYRLSDYFLDEDYFAGLVVGTLRVQRRPEATAGDVHPASAGAGGAR